jgi:hypothetical protein
MLLNPAGKFLIGLIFAILAQRAAMSAQAAAAPNNNDKAAAPEASKIGGGQPNATKNQEGYTAKDAQTNDSEPKENFETLTIPAGLTFSADSLDKIETPEYTRELVRVAWRSWDPIDLWVVKPAGVKNPPVILYLYSFPSSNDRYYNRDFCKFLVKNGFAAVGFVSALTGPRFHDRPMKKWFISELQESLITTVHDVQMTLNYLGQRGDLDMTRVGMFGDGSGASIAILAASVDPRIKALDVLNPWADWPDWLAQSSLVPEDERATYLKPEFLKTVENLDPVKYLPTLKTQYVRLQQIENLKVTPQLVRDRLEAAAPHTARIVHYGDPKIFVTEVTLSGAGFDWIKLQLTPMAPLQLSDQKSGHEIKFQLRDGHQFVSRLLCQRITGWCKGRQRTVVYEK